MTTISYNTRLSFIAEWFQREAGIVRSFYVIFFPTDNAVEVIEQKTRKTFLKRAKLYDLSQNDFYIGSIVPIYGRQFEIVDYADDHTRNELSKFRSNAFLLVKNNAIKDIGKIFCKLIECNFMVNRSRMVKLSSSIASNLLAGKTSSGDVQTTMLMNELVYGFTIGIEVLGCDVRKKILRALAMDKDSTDIKPLLEIMDDEILRHGIYCAETEEDTKNQVNNFFCPNGIPSVCVAKNSTLCVVKPHAIKEGKAGKIIQDILNRGFKITGLKTIQMHRVNCEEFYEVYKGVVPEYIQMVAELSSGISLGLEIQSKDESIDVEKFFHEFRAFCGPTNPEIAKQLRPDTLRAKYGTNRTLNAIHCTDLPEDAILEIEYFFKILD